MDPTHSKTSAAGTRPTAVEAPDLGDVVEFVTDYVKQETIGPVRGAGRWLAYGAAAALTLGLGLLLVLIGLLRLIQTEWEWAAEGSWSWVAYAVVLVVCLAVLALTLSRIKRDRLNKEPY